MKELNTKNIVIVALVAVLICSAVIIAYIAVSRDGEETTGLEIVDIKIEEPKPSIISSKSITIDLGDSVTFNVTVKNKGDNITRGDAYSVGIAVITVGGDKYWQLPAEQMVGIDLGPGGDSRHTFTAINKEELPFRGECDLQAYIKVLNTGEITALSDTVTIGIQYPA